MAAISRSGAKALSDEWSADFKMFDCWEPLWLLRRIGPLLQGIALERSSGPRYLPVLHLHALYIVAEDGPSLMFSQDLVRANGSQGWIDVPEDREWSTVAEAAASLREQSALSLAEPPTFDEIFRMMADHIDRESRRRSALGIDQPLQPEAEMLMLLPGAAGAPDDLVDEAREVVVAVKGAWSADHAWYGDLDRDGWFESLVSRARDRSALAETVGRESKRLKIDSVRQLDLGGFGE